ncbi:TPA: fimbrial protein [Escherichia coli]|nr:fimbrial protein [Escherichia coli]
MVSECTATQVAGVVSIRCGLCSTGARQTSVAIKSDKGFCVHSHIPQPPDDTQATAVPVATNIGVALFDDEGNLVPINRPPANWKRLYSGSTSLHFIAKYRATGRRVTGGIANAQAWFSLTYQ